MDHRFHAATFTPLTGSIIAGPTSNLGVGSCHGSKGWAGAGTCMLFLHTFWTAIVPKAQTTGHNRGRLAVKNQASLGRLIKVSRWHNPYIVSRLEMWCINASCSFSNHNNAMDGGRGREQELSGRPYC